MADQPLPSQDQMMDKLQKLMEKEERAYKNGERDKDDGKEQKALFGLVNLSPELHSIVNIAYGWAQPFIRDGGEKAIRTHGSELLQKTLGATKDVARTRAFHVANAAGWAYTLGSPILGAYNSASTVFDERKALAERLQPVLRAEGIMNGSHSALSKAGLSNNEIIKVEHDRIGSHLKHNLYRDVGAEMAVVAPQVLLKMRSNVIAREEFESGGMKLGEDNKARLAREKTERNEARSRSGENDKAVREEVRDWKREEISSDNNLKEIEGLTEDTDINALLAKNLKAERADKGFLNDQQKTSLKDLQNDTARFQKNERELFDKRLREEKRNPKKESEGVFSDDAVRTIGLPLGSLGAEGIRHGVTRREKKDSEYLQETALDQIEKIYDQVMRDGKIKKVDGKDLKTYVKDIFQTHQKNMGQKHIGERLNEKLDYASEQIAEAIERGRMHPMALVHLVGERTIVKKDGKVIAGRAEIDEAIDAMCQKMPAKFDVDADEYLGESTMTEEDIKHILTNLTGQARDLFVEIIPDEVLVHVGLTEEDIHSTHLRNKKEFGALLTTALMDIASMSEEDLKAAHLNDDEIKMVYDLAGKGKTGDVKSVLASVSTHGEFNKGIDWPLASMKDYWMEVANGERQIGDEYKKNGEELVPEVKAREEEEAKAIKEAEEKSAKEAKKSSDDKEESPAVEGDEKEPTEGKHAKKHAKKKPTLAHESKLMSSEMNNPFDDAEAANDASLDMPDTHISSAKNHEHLESRDAAIGGRA